MSYMLVNDEIKIALEWEKYKGYTVRPLQTTINYYEKMILTYLKQEPSLLYGGTPEIRTLFQKHNLKVTIVDCSELMVRAMGYLAHNRIPLSENEYFVESDWLTIDPPIGKVSLAIGDDAINMVSWSDFPIFIQNVHKLLLDDGVFICRLLIKPDDKFIDQNFFHVIDEFKNDYIKSRYDLVSRLNFICYDKKNYSMGWQQTIKQLGKDRLDYLAFDSDLDFVGTFGFCNSKFYCPPKKEFEYLISDYFKILEIFHPSEYEYCMYEPVYLLQKKN